MPEEDMEALYWYANIREAPQTEPLSSSLINNIGSELESMQRGKAEMDSKSIDKSKQRSRALLARGNKGWWQGK